jgi:SAM-dependent methyltransferase
MGRKGSAGPHYADASVNAPLTGHLLATSGIDPADRVLDIGCGTGGTSIAAARAAHRGHVVGVDLSEPMLARARAAAADAGLTNVEFLAGDAQTHRLGRGTFDKAISQFGVMFFVDPVAAFANIGRTLRAGGRLAFVCPQQVSGNDWYRVPMTALQGHEPSDGDSAMFSLADPTRVHDVLAEAGFDDIAADPLHVALRFGPDLADAVGFFLNSGPVRALLERRSAHLTPEAARRTLTSTLRPYAQAGGVRLDGAHWLVTATRL